MRTALGKAISHQSSVVRLIAVFISLATCYLLLTTTSYAAVAWNAQSQSTFTLGNLFESGVFGLSGVCLDNNGSVEVGQNQILPCNETIASGGAIGFTSGVLASLYSPPTSSVYYLANLGESLGIGPNIAYAQVPGSGQGIIAPVFTLWQLSRNLAYYAFIIVFIVVGFMIMFRQKLNPQTVIGVQQALPGLIVGLILITFSYLIASFIVDVAFWGVQFVVYIFTQPGTLPNSLGTAQQISDLAENGNIFNLFGGSALNGKNLETVFNGVSGQLDQITGGNTGTFSLFAGVIMGVVGLLAGPLGGLAGLATGAGAIPVIIPALVSVVLLIALFIQMFKLLFALLKAYISILIMTLAGPLFILMGAIPGKSNAVSNWIKNLLANVLIFPAVFAAFLLAGFILGNNQGWDSNSALPLFGNLNNNFIRILIAYGILLGTPGIPDAIKGALGVKDQNPFVQAAMGGAMAGTTVGTTATTAGYGKLWRGGAQAGQPAKGPVATWAKNRGWYRPTVGRTTP